MWRGPELVNILSKEPGGIVVFEVYRYYYHDVRTRNFIQTLYRGDVEPRASALSGEFQVNNHGSNVLDIIGRTCLAIPKEDWYTLADQLKDGFLNVRVHIIYEQDLSRNRPGRCAAH